MLATSDLVVVGAVDIRAQNSISFGDNAGLNAGSSTIMLAANQDGLGTQGITQNSTAIIRTTNETDHALVILVGRAAATQTSPCSRPAQRLLAPFTSLSAARSLIIGSNEDPNVTARTAVINAGAGIGGTGDADIDTAVAFLSGGTTSGDIHLDAVADVQLQGLLAPAGSIFVNSGGHISILNGTFLESSTGTVSNAPPLLRVEQQDPERCHFARPIRRSASSARLAAIQVRWATIKSSART